MKNIFINIDPKKLNANIFHLLDDDWMLISAGNDSEVNMMTASWGGFGILWNKPVATIFIRPQRYTFNLVNESEVFSLSFFPEKYRNELTFCGTKSGKDVNKIANSGLTAFKTKNGCYSFEEAKIYFECRKLYADWLNSSSFIEKTLIKGNYPNNDFHQFTIGEIIGCHIKK